jgi:DDE superfamily endonuclease
VELVRRAVQANIPFRAVVADSCYGEDRGVKQGLRALGVGYVLALKPAHAWWHPAGAIGSFQEAAQAAGWKSALRPGKWVKVIRTFRDGSSQDWWALEVVTGPSGPSKKERVVIATTDPVTLPDLTTFYLVTNLPAPGAPRTADSGLAAASLQEVLRLYGLRMGVEQSDKQIKHTFGWSQSQVRSDRAMRRHWQLVCCAFSFCWYHASHLAARTTQAATEPSEPQASSQASVPAPSAGTGKKIGEEKGVRPQVSWPMARRSVRGWLEPWIMLRRYGRGWSQLPPPPALQFLLGRLEQGHAIPLYSSA